MNAKKLCKTLAVLTLLLSSNLYANDSKSTKSLNYEDAQALAESLNLPEGFSHPVNDDDIAFQILRSTLGDPIYTIVQTDNHQNVPGNPTITTWLIGVVAAVSIFIAAMWAVFFLGKGLVVTNTTGSFSGKNSKENETSSTAIKFAFVTFANMPLPKLGGISFSQAMIISICVAGIAAGSAVWKKASEYLLTQPMISFHYENMAPLFVSAIQSKSCLIFAVENGYLTKNEAQIYTETRPKNLIFEEQVMLFGKDAFCGEVALQVPLQSSTNIFTETPKNEESFFGTSLKEIGSFLSSSSDSVNAATSSNGDLTEQWIYGNASAAVNESLVELMYDNGLSNVLNDYVTRPISPGKFYDIRDNDIATLQLAYSRFEQKIVSRMSSLMSSINCTAKSESESVGCKANMQAAEEMSRFGFAMAGSYVMTLNQRQSMISAAISNAIPETTNFNIEKFVRNTDISASSVATQSFYVLFRSLDETLRAYSRVSGDALADSLNTAYESTTEDSIVSEVASDILTEGWRAIISAGTTWGEHETLTNPEPISMLRSMGNWMINLPVAAYAGTKLLSELAGGPLMKTASITSKIIDRIPALNNDSREPGFLLELANTVMQSAVFVGVFFSQVVPNLPFVIWFLSIANYIIYVLIAAISVPLMLTSRLVSNTPMLPDIKTLATDLFLRPTLLIIGLILAMVVSRGLAGFLNGVIFETMQLNQSGNISLASAIGIPVMWGLLMTLIVYKSYSLINEVPAQVIAFMRGDMNPRMDTDSDKNMVVANFQQTAGRLETGVGKSATAAGKTNKQNDTKGKQETGKLSGS